MPRNCSGRLPGTWGTVQSRAQQVDKSQVRGPLAEEDSPASIHGASRLVSGFTIDQVLAERRPITVRIESGGSDVFVRIHNEGKPIDPAAVPAIFDPLVRFANPGTQAGASERSLGIGLYIARVIVEAHGGDIAVTSDAEHGTTFSVRLPRIPSPARQARM